VFTLVMVIQDGEDRIVVICVSIIQMFVLFVWAVYIILLEGV
jgi:hypothetical protein